MSSRFSLLPAVRALRWRQVVPALLPFVVACQGDHLNPPPPIDPAVLYWKLELNHHAVTLSTLAPYDTLKLTATPQNQAGEPLSGLPAPSYRSTKPDQVAVTVDGVLVAARPTDTPVSIIATVTSANLKHEDTVLVRVMADSAPKLGSFSIHPVPPDSAKFPAAGRFGDIYHLLNARVHATDAGGTPITSRSVDFDPTGFGTFPIPISIPDLLVSFRSSDTTVAYLSSTADGSGGMPYFRLNGRRPGTVTLTATTTVFGKVMADTIPFRVGMPLYAGFIYTLPKLPDGSVSPIPQLIPNLPTTVMVGPGGMVSWDTYGAAPDVPNLTLAVRFSDPTKAAATNDVPYNIFGFFFGCLIFIECSDAEGDIAPSLTPWLKSRRFPVPGTYTYSVVTDANESIASGQIVVVDE